MSPALPVSGLSLLRIGLWRQHELRDGTCTLDDLPDIMELIRVRNENQIRAADASRI